MVESGQTLSAESVSAMNENSRYLLSHIELAAAIVAVVQASTLIVSLQKVLRLSGLNLRLLLPLLLLSLLPQRLPSLAFGRIETASPPLSSCSVRLTHCLAGLH